MPFTRDHRYHFSLLLKEAGSERGASGLRTVDFNTDDDDSAIEIADQVFGCMVGFAKSDSTVLAVLYKDITVIKEYKWPEGGEILIST